MGQPANIDKHVHIFTPDSEGKFTVCGLPSRAVAVMFSVGGTVWFTEPAICPACLESPEVGLALLKDRNAWRND